MDSLLLGITVISVTSPFSKAVINSPVESSFTFFPPIFNIKKVTIIIINKTKYGKKFLTALFFFTSFIFILFLLI